MFPGVDGRGPCPRRRLQERTATVRYGNDVQGSDPTDSAQSKQQTAGVQGSQPTAMYVVPGICTRRSDAGREHDPVLPEPDDRDWDPEAGDEDLRQVTPEDGSHLDFGADC